MSEGGGAKPTLLEALAAAWDAADEPVKREFIARLRPYVFDDEDARLLDTAQKARQLHVHAETLARWAHEGRVPGAEKIGRRWLFPVACEVLPAVGSCLPYAPGSPRQRSPVAARSSLIAIRGR
jgi:Helix-turn-helix domain